MFCSLWKRKRNSCPQYFYKAEGIYRRHTNGVKKIAINFVVEKLDQSVISTRLSTAVVPLVFGSQLPGSWGEKR